MKSSKIAVEELSMEVDAVAADILSVIGMEDKYFCVCASARMLQ